MLKYVVAILMTLQYFVVLSQDLIATGYKGPTEFDQYQYFSQVFTIKNSGIIDVGANSNFCIAYLSTDAMLNDGDNSLGTGLHPKLGPNQSIDVTITGSGPRVAPGTYFLLLKLDHYNDVKETDETNNIYVVPGIVVKAPDIDWSFTALDISGGNHCGEQKIFSFGVQNTGATNVGGFLYHEFYLSTDAVLDNNDQLLNKDRTLFQGEHAKSGIQASGFIPPIAPGEFYFIGKIDCDNDFEENSETNNLIIKGPFTIVQGDIDLTITQIHLVQQTEYSFDLMYSIRNNGTTAVGGYELEVSLSTELGGPPILSWERPMGPYVLPSEEKMELLHLSQLPFDPGSYYVTLTANPRGFQESEFANNSITSDNPVITILPPRFPKIATISASLNRIYYDTDTQVGIDIVFENTGDADGHYISYDLTIKDSGGSPVANSNTILSAQFTGTQTHNTSIPLDNVLLPGNYTLEITSYDNASITPSYIVSITISPSAYTLTGTIIGTDGTPITKGKLFVYHKDESAAIKFINKVVLDGSNTFAFNLDQDSYTLYFIPDAAAYPDYVPTIYGKTVLLGKNSFFNLTASTNIELEILKIEPLPPGPMSISGNIYDQENSSGRSDGRTGEPVTGHHVILLSATGIPVAVTTTDNEGHYEFTNLPKDTYQIVIPFELDQVQMQEPVIVDVRTSNATVNFDLTASELVVVKQLGQIITFAALMNKTYGDEPFAPAVSSSSQLPVTLQSSDESVAVIENGMIKIIGAGESDITATQIGDDTYGEATPVTRKLLIRRSNQTIAFDPFPEMHIGESDYNPNATSTSQLPITYFSSNKAVASISENTIHINGEGTTTITATQSGDKNYYPAVDVEQVLRVGLISGVERDLAAAQIYPNPVSTLLYVNSSRKIEEATIVNSLGIVQNVQVIQEAINVSSLPAGLYILNLKFSGKVMPLRFTKF